MFMNENNKYIDAAEYFYNPYINMYCIVGTTLSAEDISDLIAMFEAPELLTEVNLPEYIVDENYDEAEW